MSLLAPKIAERRGFPGADGEQHADRDAVLERLADVVVVHLGELGRRFAQAREHSLAPSLAAPADDEEYELVRAVEARAEVVRLRLRLEVLLDGSVGQPGKRSGQQKAVTVSRQQLDDS